MVGRAGFDTCNESSYHKPPNYYLSVCSIETAGCSGLIAFAILRGPLDMVINHAPLIKAITLLCGLSVYFRHLPITVNALNVEG